MSWVKSQGLGYIRAKCSQ